MKRNIEKKLLEWKQNPNRKPLVIRGARQVGKTYSINEFGKLHYPNFIRIDFERDFNARRIFDGDLEPNKLFDRICIEKGVSGTLQNTLVFFDEVQVCPRALLSLRYFHEDVSGANIIAAGSQLEFALGEVSFPVGRVEFLWMYPMTFSEFLDAAHQNKLLEHLPDISMEEAVDAYIHEKLFQELKKYFFVGGMPEAVKAFCTTESFTEVRTIQSNLCNSYIDDFSKYNAKTDRFLLETVFRRLPLLAGNHLKYSNLADGVRTEKIRQVFLVLQKALISYMVPATNGKQPLAVSSNQRIFKTVFIDIGLMQYLCDVPISEIMDSRDLTESYHGILAEQFVGQQLISSSFDYPVLYFWNRLKPGSLAELDYLVSRNGMIVPIEVKSGSSGSLKSMHLFLETFPEVHKGYIFSQRNISEIKEQRLKFVPLYSKV
jgi:uncharacterized protein